MIVNPVRINNSAALLLFLCVFVVVFCCFFLAFWLQIVNKSFSVCFVGRNDCMCFSVMFHWCDWGPLRGTSVSLWIGAASKLKEGFRTDGTGLGPTINPPSRFSTDFSQAIPLLQFFVHALVGLCLVSLFISHFSVFWCLGKAAFRDCASSLFSLPVFSCFHYSRLNLA